MLAKTKEIATLAKMTPGGTEPLSGFLQGFSSVMNCRVCLCDLDGSILLQFDGSASAISADEPFEMIAVSEDELSHVSLPLVCKGTHCGTMLMKKKEAFTDYDAVLADLATVFIAQELQHDSEKEKELAVRLHKAVHHSLESLSYSERAAFAKVAKELAGNEGVLVASKIAEQNGVKRSAIVNAIRKLESAGIIESRSLGVKGTFIRILNPEIVLALKMEA
jgi:transcriptional pleiotropic repressor